MLEAVGHPRAVNPDRALAKIARAALAGARLRRAAEDDPAAQDM